MSHDDIDREAGCIAAAAQVVSGWRGDYDALMRRVGDARYVLIGTASHGTHELHRIRSEITQRLIYEQGFAALAVATDWPDAYGANRYASGREDYANASLALARLRRFPSWLWRNTVVRDFVGWLRLYNDGLRPGVERIGLYGLDLYSYYASVAAVLAYLDPIDATAVQQVRRHFVRFDHVGIGDQATGEGSGLDLGATRQAEAVEWLLQLRRQAAAIQGDGGPADDEPYYLGRHAALELKAAGYYRTMLGERVAFWNARERHLADSLDALAAHLSRGGRRARIVVWGHNSQVGDAGASARDQRGEVSLGELVRQRHGDDALLVGFTTGGGTVTTAADWNEPPRVLPLPPALPDSYEYLFHYTHQPAFYLDTRGSVAREGLAPRRLERAIGLIYRPESERLSHYYAANIGDQFDVVMHVDSSTALRPLDLGPLWQPGPG
ncbi:MAG: erythromycin esterase family protein [Anaerolineae bacterium]